MMSSIYQEQGDYSNAFASYQKALDILKKNQITDSDVASCYSGIGYLYLSQQNYYKALEYCNKALEIYERVNGPFSLEAAGIYSTIGIIYIFQQNYDKSLEYHQKSLFIRERVYGPDHPDVAISYNNLGWVYENQGDYSRAIEYYQKSLAIRERVLGPDHPYTQKTEEVINHLKKQLGQ